MQSFLPDLRFSARSLLKSPGFAITAILTLALGIGAVTSIFSVVHSVLLQPLPFPKPNELVVLRERMPEVAPGPLPDNAKHFLNWQESSRTLAAASLFENNAYSISTGTDHPEIVSGLQVDAEFFKVLDVQPALGRAFLPSETAEGHQHEVILSWDAWQRDFHGDQDVIGRDIRVGGSPRTVVGVLPRNFDFPHVSESAAAVSQNAAAPYEIFSPLVVDANQTSDAADFDFLAIARLRPGASLRQAQVELNTIQAAFNRERHMSVHPTVVVQSLLTEVTGHISKALWLLLASVTAVLLIGCVNLANLQLARAVSRERELAVRAAIGATPQRLLWSALCDSLVLAAVGGVLGIILSFVGVRFFVAAAPQDLPRLGETHVSWMVLLAAAAISILTAVLFGILPALRSMRVNPQAAMQSNSARMSSGRDSRRTRHLLVAGEVAFTLALLIVTGLLVRSFSNVLHQDRDFDASHITLASVYLYAPQYGDTVPHADTARAAFTERTLADLSAIPGVESVASTSEKPMTGDTWIDEIRRPDHPVPASQMPNANVRWISPSYAATLQIPVVEGRDLNASDKNHPTNALISQQTAHSVWPGEDPIGRSFQLGDNIMFTVVGVIADARINDLKSSANMVYIPYWQNPWWRVHFLVRSAQPAASLVSEVRHVIWNVDPQVAIPTLTSLDEQISNSVATERFQTLLLSSFGAAGLLLALLGIYGVLAYSVSLRQQEFGIRIALGCEKPLLMAMVAGQAALPVAGGIVAGLVLAFFGSRWVHSLLYETSTVDPWTIVSSIGLLLVAALIAALLPARRAAMTNPMKVLRNE